MSELSNKLNMIWYGDAELHETSPCVSFPLDGLSAIKRVYHINDNLWMTYRKDFNGTQAFDHLECGHSYVVELEDNSTVSIPHANMTGYGTGPQGLLVKEVTLAAPSPTPTPTPTPVEVVACVPSGFSKVSYSASGITGLSVAPFSMVTWPSGDVSDFAWNPADFSTGPGLAKEINVWDGNWQVIKVTTDMTPPTGETPTVYWEYQGNCYSGDLAVQGDGSYTVVLTQISTGPAPSPTPTPTPVVASGPCGESSSNGHDSSEYGAWDISAAYAADVGSLFHEMTTGSTPRHKLIDRGDLPTMESQYPAGDHSYPDWVFLQLEIRSNFGTPRGELTYNRLADPKLNYDAIGGPCATWCFFEEDLPLADTSDMISKVLFSLKKNIIHPSAAAGGAGTASELFLEIDGKCYYAVLGADHSDAPGGWDSTCETGLPITVFREV